jgi:hypothetical protein
MANDKNNVKSDLESQSDLEPTSDSDSDQNHIEEDKQNETDIYDYDDNHSDSDYDDINVLGHTISSNLKDTKRLCDTVNASLKDSHFVINMNGKTKYLHKNTAC